MINAYLTIQEFAEEVGVSKQAIYQQLNKKLKPYFKLVDNKKMINSTAIFEVYHKEFNSTIDKDVYQSDCQELINELKEHIKDLQNQLAIAKADKDIKDQQIKDLNDRLSEANALNKNNQLLISRQQEQPILSDFISTLDSATPEHPKKSTLRNRLKFIFGGD